MSNPNFSEVDLSLDIQSNVNYPVTINVLGNPYNLLDTTNAKKEYRWNLTAFTFTNETKVAVQYKQNSEPSFSIFTQDLAAQNIDSVVAALNLLGIGFFSSYTELGQTYIGTYNDNYTFGSLNIYNPAILTYRFSAVGTGGVANIVNNTTAQTLFTGTTPQVTALTGDLSSQASVGDSITFSGNGDNLGILVRVIRVDLTTFTQTNIFTQALAPAAGFTYTFTLASGFTYQCLYRSP